MERVIGLGAGGHAKVVIEILRLLDNYEIVGLLDPRQTLWGNKVLGIPVLGDDDLLPTLHSQGIRSVFIGIGMVGDARPRRKAYEKARSHGFQVVQAIHPQAVIAPSVKIGHGPTIMAGAVINADTRLGNNVIINTGAIVEHDCVIGDHSHIATGARLAGAVHVGEGTHVGLGASVIQGVEIGRNAVIGAGAVVVRNVPDNAVVAGVPARILRMVEE